MKRFTTDNPQNNFETMMNLVYAKDVLRMLIACVMVLERSGYDSNIEGSAERTEEEGERWREA